MIKTTDLTTSELNEIFTFLKNLIAEVCYDEFTNMEDLNSYVENKENIENFMSNNDYTNYKEFLINCLDQEIRYNN